MSTPVSTRTLYYGFAVAVLSTLMCLGLLTPVTPVATERAERMVHWPPAEVPALVVAASKKQPAPPENLQPAQAPEPPETLVTGRSISMNPLPQVRTPAPLELTLAAVLEPESPVPVFPITIPERPADEPDHDGTPAGRGEYALTRIDYDTDRLGFTISYEPGRPGYLGLTFVEEQRIEIYLREDMSDDVMAFVLAHEIGHAVDLVLNDADDRAAWRSIRNMAADAAWWPQVSATDWDTPAGDFAECFAVWATGLQLAETALSCDGTEELLAELAAGDPVADEETDRGGNPDAVLATTD